MGNRTVALARGNANEMEISYANSKILKICTDARIAQKVLGKANAEILRESTLEVTRKMQKYYPILRKSGKTLPDRLFPPLDTLSEFC